MREMRRSDRQMSEEAALALLIKGEYGILCFGEIEGYPYGVPISYAVKDGKIYMHSATEGKKLDAAKNSETASFVVVGETKVLPEKFSTAFESVVAFGKVRLVTEGPEKHEALMALVEKYSPGFEMPGEKYALGSGHKTTVMVIDIDHVTGKERSE